MEYTSKNIGWTDKEITSDTVNATGIFISAMTGNSHLLREYRIKRLANDIKALLIERKKMRIPEIMGEFDVTAVDAIDAVEILKKKGIVKEII
jgi:predicted DNA-binding transcriptional regulator